MYRTIQLSSCVLVQGEFVEVLADGRIVIKDGTTTYRGRPIARRSASYVPEAQGRSSDIGAFAS